MNNLIAPNGKKSNLSYSQYKLVRLPEFKAWFGDWENHPENASKVVDENGEPMVLYHASINDFNEFEEKYINSNETDALINGFWFTTNKQTSPAWISGNYTKSFFLCVKNQISHKEVYDIFIDIYENIEEYRDYGDYEFSIHNKVREIAKSKFYDGYFHIKILFLIVINNKTQ